MVAVLVQPQPDEPLTDYTARIQAAESGARRTWEAYRFRPAKTHQGQADRVRSVLARLSNNAGRMTPKPEPKSGSVDNDGNKPKPTRVMSRPCRHCGGGHWDNECTKKKVHFATTETEEPSDDEVDVDLLERLADELDNTSKKLALRGDSETITPHRLHIPNFYIMAQLQNLPSCLLYGKYCPRTCLENTKASFSSPGQEKTAGKLPFPRYVHHI